MLPGHQAGNLSRREETMMEKPSVTLYVNNPMGKR
jgi:hypothetical protein